jgi:hypothetical protein
MDGKPLRINYSLCFNSGRDHRGAASCLIVQLNPDGMPENNGAEATAVLGHPRNARSTYALATTSSARGGGGELRALKPIARAG